MKIFTWKDVERKALLNKGKWETCISNIAVYSSVLVVTVNSDDKIEEAKKALGVIFLDSYNADEGRINLEFEAEYLEVEFEIDVDVKMSNYLTPLFNNVLYQKSAYKQELFSRDLPGCPVIAFHSYKGGVGRTLSLLAFVKAWSSVNPQNKLLIIDSDIEAPGLTWLSNESVEAEFSYLDLLETIQNHNEIDKIIADIADRLSNMTLKFDTKDMRVEHFILPTYRYIEQLLDMYSSPESIVKSYKKEYIIAEILSKLGKQLGVGAVVVDLRAGVSEFSAPLLFDPRVKKYIVTSTSYQSIKGTNLLIGQLSKGLPMNEDILMPEIFLSMIPDGFDSTAIISELVSAYSFQDLETSFMDNLVTELPFASELVHLENIDHIMRNLEGREFYNRICQLVKNEYIINKTVEEKKSDITRESAINKIHEFAEKQITAEGNASFEVLATQSINNIVKKYNKNIPVTVVLGAKGAGKTFLYREILKKKYWEDFIYSFKINPSSVKADSRTIAIPLLAPRNMSGLIEIFEGVSKEIIEQLSFANIKNTYWSDNSKKINSFKENIHSVYEWKEFWEALFLNVFSPYMVLEDVEKKLFEENKRVVFLIDGLEEVLTKTSSDQTERNAVISLVQEMINEFSIKYKNIGIIVFLRKDLARDSITINYQQFYDLFKQFELNWSSTEALRLVLWLVNQAIPGFYEKRQVNIEVATMDVIEDSLTKLWGSKLGKDKSNEAYSARWILAALSDFNGQLQARDIMRFLQYATKETGREVYEGRYIMPSEIKKAVPNCSTDKIEEIKQEIAKLSPIFDKLEALSPDKRILPFGKEAVNLSAVEESAMKQEGFLIEDSGKYYLPEIIRHALSFKYEKGARPKVLSLILKK